MFDPESLRYNVLDAPTKINNELIVISRQAERSSHVHAYC